MVVMMMMTTVTISDLVFPHSVLLCVRHIVIQHLSCKAKLQAKSKLAEDVREAWSLFHLILGITNTNMPLT